MAVPAIWTVPDVLSAARAHNTGLLVEHLGIEFTAIGDNWLEARMPVVQHNKQPAGLLHGGASLVTVTSSDIALTPSLTGTLAVKPMPIRTLGFVVGAKPASSNFTKYVPAGNPGKR